MPTYEYACKSCGKHHEVQQSFIDDALTTCPTCGGQLRKVFGNIAISFKGSGFYSTDNRSVAKAGATKGDGDGQAGTDGASKSDAAASSEGSKSESSETPKAETPKPSTSDSPKSGEKTTAAAP